MKRLTLITNPDKCNLHCPLCFLNQRRLHAGDDGCGFGMGEMPFEIARAAIEKYAAERDALENRVLREVIPSTMGEPLLYSHFDELLELCCSLGIPLNLTTNGTFPGKWGSESGMETLLRSCSDIKVSYLASEVFEGWKANVQKLLAVRNRLAAATFSTSAHIPAASPLPASLISTISLQVTLHKKNLADVPEILAWASSAGVDRIKWNPVFLLKDAPAELKREYALDGPLDDVRAIIMDKSGAGANARAVKNEGSLFMRQRGAFSKAEGTCPFAGEVWVLPDGSEDFCPSPERRYGDKRAECCFVK